LVAAPTIYRLAGVLSVLALLLAMATGLVASLRGEGRLPSPAPGYVQSVKRLVRDGHYQEAQRQLRLALLLDGAGAGLGAAPVLVEVARSRGDLDDEILALRTWVRAHARDSRSRTDLGGALLRRALESGDPGAHRADLLEASAHAAAALELAPGSARARALAGELAGQLAAEPAP
jgi:hypothetical protein